MLDEVRDALTELGVSGILGFILTGVFAVEAVSRTRGMLEGNAIKILPQLYGVGVTVAYSGIFNFILIKFIGAIMSLRIKEDDEILRSMVKAYPRLNSSF